MGSRKEEPSEIPIQFVDKDEEAEAAGEQASPDGEDSQPVMEAAGVELAEAGPEEAQQPGDDAADLGQAWSELQDQVEKLTREKADLYDKLLRRQAEFENYRRRVEREKAETYERARERMFLELLPVLDNFERALESLENSQGDANALHQGVELIHKQFRDALTKLGLQPFESVGKAFDPHLHEAVSMEQTDEHEDNTVIEEFQRGYRLGDRLLRPAKVKVATSPDR
ncbi:MAG TPA: nucleotide exchange factor GrpE [Blastocatellia bacterium]|nr:nucleotide exchange factor GrpE [Blastocatellia bacterium]